jgi:hypothetical protein
MSVCSPTDRYDDRRATFLCRPAARADLPRVRTRRASTPRPRAALDGAQLEVIAIHIVNDYHIARRRLAPEAVLVTGCSSGIGRATALALARAGFPVWASARHTAHLCELKQAGCRVVELDVTDEQSRVAAVREVEAEHGLVGVLVNNAGHGGGGPVEEVPMDLVREIFDTNVFGLIRCASSCCPACALSAAG